MILEGAMKITRAGKREQDVKGYLAIAVVLSAFLIVAYNSGGFFLLELLVLSYVIGFSVWFIVISILVGKNILKMFIFHMKRQL